MTVTSSSPIHELVAMRAALSDKLAALKSELADVDAAVAHLALPAMTDRLKLSGKEHGSLKLILDGVAVQGEITKTVKWDSDALKEIARKIVPADASVIFTVTLSVSEDQVAMLEECDHPALGEILLARSVKLSAFKATPAK